MPNRLSVALFLLLAFALTACGSVATPVPGAETREAQQTIAAVEAEAEDAEDIIAADEAVAVEPTEVPPTATFTPEPPTVTPTEAPPTATTAPTEMPTDAPDEQPAASTDQVAQLANLLGDPAQGETIFNATYTTAIGDWACSLCHNVAVPDQLIGPSLLGIADRAGERVEGQVAERYIWNSIIAPQEYIVEGYAEGAQMPGNYREIFTDDELYHLIAYLMTLEE